MVNRETHDVFESADLIAVDGEEPELAADLVSRLIYHNGVVDPRFTAEEIRLIDAFRG